jgi:Fic family protein
MATYIWQQPNWPDWTFDLTRLAAPLASVRHAQGRLLGRMESLGFKSRDEAWLKTLTEDVVKTS